MSDKIKDTEKVDVNNGLQAINEDDLGEVAGGKGWKGLLLEICQRSRMSSEEKEDIRSLIKKHDNLMNQFDDLSLVASENPKFFNEDIEIRKKDVKIRKELVEVKDKLRNYYKRFSNIPELKPFR